MTMFKLETMIYASEDGTSSVFTLNPALQKQLDVFASQHPEVCCRKKNGDTGGATVSIQFSHKNLYLIALVEDVKALLSIFVHKL